MDAHIYHRKTGDYIRTVSDIKPGQIIDVEGDPSEIEIVYTKIKSANVWKCEDCHSIGFYYFMTDEEIKERHAKECTLIPPSRWINGQINGVKKMNNFTAPLMASFGVRVQRLLGDNYIFCTYVPGWDPAAPIEAWVACKRHKTHKTIKLGDDFPSDDEILEAARSCEACIYENAATMPVTRWPKAGEDGGAEL